MNGGSGRPHLCTAFLTNLIFIMKAAVYQQYGAPEVLQIQELTTPSPKRNEVLIRIRATAVTSGDCRLRAADPFAVRFLFGLFSPSKKVLGEGFSGEVEAVGSAVTQFKPGDQVFGSAGMGFGAYAEYICLPENGAIDFKPENITHEAAASAVFGGATALHFIQKANIQPGQKVLVYGASGSVGSAAVQLAHYFGAEVTGVCSGANATMVKNIGATDVIDYTQTDFSTTGKTWDVVYETVNKAPVSSCFAAVKAGGTLLLGAAMPPEMIRGKWGSLGSSKKVIAGVAFATPEAISFLAKLMAEGSFTPVIDRQFPLTQIIDAHRYVDMGHKKGNVAVVC